MKKEEFSESQQAFLNKHGEYFQGFLLSLLAGRVSRRYIPDLIFSPGKDCYTDHQKIVLGLDQKRYPPDTELYAFIKFVSIHEAQHVKSTPSKPWVFSINQGVKYVVEYFMKQYGYPATPLIGEMAIRQVLKKLFDDGHKVPTYGMIVDFVHFYHNACEDGRIEEKIMAEYPGARAYVRLVRGNMWFDNAETKYEFPLSAANKLAILGNEVLSLATTRMYEKNFWEFYGGTDIEEFISKKIKPHVARAVFSRECKHAMSECLEIVKLITPIYFEAIQSTPDPETIKQILDALSKALNSMDPADGSGIKESSEDKNTPSGVNPFGTSVLGDPVLDENGEFTGEVKDSNGEKGENESVSNNNSDSNELEGKGAKSAEGNSAASDGSDGESNSSSSRSENPVGSKTAGSFTGEFSEETLRKEIEEAAKRVSSDFSASSGNKMDNDVFINEVYDNSSNAAEAANISGIPFKEYQRAYSLDIPLPYIIRERGRTLKERVTQIFRPRKPGMYRKKTSGGLDTKSIYSLAMGNADVFQTKRKPEERSCCAYILQDNSGSMGGGYNSKRMFASEASAVIEYAFKDVMPLKIVAFDDMATVIHEVIKNWGDKTNMSCSYNFFWKGREGSSNNDSDSIAVATEELKKRPEKDRVLIVISDGLPCGSYSYKNKSAEESVKAAVDYARSCGIYVVGIYIEDVINNSIRKKYNNMYGAACVFTDSDHLTEELVKVMEGWVLH